MMVDVRIRGEGKESYGISVNFIVKVDAQARVHKDDMCGFRENVIA